MSLFESALARIWPAYPIAHGGVGGAAATSNVAGLLLTGQAAGAAPTMTSAAAMVLTWQEAASALAQSALGAKEKEQVWPYMVLAAAYGLVGFIALVQLVRIQRRVPEYGWTTQKVFHLLNFVVNANHDTQKRDMTSPHKLFLMLRRFPIESRGRRKKLHEVGMVTLICFTCFTIRACIMAYSAFFNPTYDVDTLEHPGYDAIYYSLVELIPSALVLYILRKLPPKRNSNSQTLR